MTAPKWATTTETGRHYENPLNPGVVYTSVTTAIGCLDKGDAIPGWAAKCASEQLYDLWNTRELEGEFDFREAKSAWKDVRAEAGRKGDLVHDYAEAYFNGEDRPVHPDVKGHIAHFHLWLREHDILPLFVEPTVYNDHLSYAGSCDLIAVVDGFTTLIDYKTSKHISPTVALQCAAYANGDYLVTDDGDQHAIPKIERCAVLHLRPRGHKFLELDAQADTYQSFVDLLSVRRYWVDDLSASVILDAIEPKETK